MLTNRRLFSLNIVFTIFSLHFQVFMVEFLQSFQLNMRVPLLRGGRTMLSRCSTLIVDDDLFARGIIRHHLTRLGIKNIFEASDGEEALEILRQAKMDLIIADRYMPKLNGLELFCNLQMEPLLKDTPFVMITMENDETKIADAWKQGIRHYLVKPFNAEIFDDKIQEVLQQPIAETLSE